MKNIFPKFDRLSALFVNQHAELLWSFATSINNLFVFISSFIYVIFDYITNFFGYVFFSLFANKLDKIQDFTGEKFNFSLFSTKFGESNTSLLPNYIEKTLEICFLVGFIEILYSFFFLGSAEILLSNESLWLIALTAAVLGGNKYYQVVYGSQKNSMEIQISSITKLMNQNAELAEEISNLEVSIIAEQLELAKIFEDLYVVVSANVENFDNDVSVQSSEAQYLEVVNSVFAEQLKYFVAIYLARESVTSNTILKDLNEEIAFETFEDFSK